MPNDVIVQDAKQAIREAVDFLAARTRKPEQRENVSRRLRETERLLAEDLEDRKTGYLEELETGERAKIDAEWARFSSVDHNKRLDDQRTAQNQRFERLRQLNNGGYPLNLSPVLYGIPLILLGLGEWYVNYSTFAAKLVPAFAIAATLVVAVVFAVTSHVHGAFVKQISEIMHPSVEYRHVRDRKIIFVLMTFVLILAFGAVAWLRYVAIAEQLGLDQTATTSVFGAATASKVWSLLLPTIVLNIAIWGVGTFYSWWFHERIPELRESYRQLQDTNRRLDRAKRPIEREIKRISAEYDRERKNNEAVRREAEGLLDELSALTARVAE